MGDYIDLQIVDQDLNLDASGEPVLVSDLASLAQDLRHSILESGYMLMLIGERNPQRRELALQKVELLVDEDTRLVAGSASITEINEESYLVKAEAINLGIVEITI